MSYKDICDELVRLFALKLQEEASEKLSSWSTDSLTDFWCWLTNCQIDTQKSTTDEELSENIRTKLSQILNRCDSDMSLFKYIMKSINNFSSKDKDYFCRFARHFYKKTREALINDDRFIPVRQDEHLFFGLHKWGDAIREFCEKITSEIMEIAKSLKENGYFPIITLPRNDKFISKKELANASYRTLDYEKFHFFCTLHAIFDLLKTSGQFGNLIPEIVNTEQPNDEGDKNNGIESIPSPGPLPSGLFEEGYSFAHAFWQALNKQERDLLAFYIIPKADGQKIARGYVFSKIGFNNEVTMKNHEKLLVERFKAYCNEQGICSEPELCRSFMQELEMMTEDLKIMKTGHSYMVTTEDK